MRHGAFALFFALSLVAVPSRGQIVIDLPPPSIYIAVGTMGATIDRVTFPLGTQPIGTPIPQLEAAVTVEIAYYRSPGDPNRVFVTMTPTPATGLSNGIVSVPWTEISWTSSDTSGQGLPSGAFTGAPNQALTSFPGGIASANRRGANLTYSYANSASVASGTYDGRVTFTATTP